MKQKAFSAGLARLVRHGLDNGVAARPAGRKAAGLDSMEEFLQILHKLVELTPRVSAAVQAALDRNKARE
jgi:hypothetical protein